MMFPDVVEKQLCHTSCRYICSGKSLSELKAVCAFACRPDSDLHNLPFAVSSDDLLTALVSTTTVPVASPRQS